MLMCVSAEMFVEKLVQEILRRCPEMKFHGPLQLPAFVEVVTNVSLVLKGADDFAQTATKTERLLSRLRR
jgi:hypothetical protein